MFPGSITTPGGAFSPYPSAWAQFATDPANAQALQGYQQVMAMMQQAGGFMPFAYPGMMPLIMPPAVSTPSTFVPRMVPIHPVNLTGTMNEAAPSNVHEVDEVEQEAARRGKGKAIAKPSKTRDSAFKCLGDKEDGPRKSAKLRLGPEMGRTSAMERLGGSSHTMRMTWSIARKLRALEEKVEEKAGAKKHALSKSPFSARVHAQNLRRKVKLDVEKFTGKEDPNVHLDTFHNAAQMTGCTDAEECLLFFSSLRGRPVEWFNSLRHGKIGSFEKLAEIFRKKYEDSCIKRKKFTYLNTVGQREKESLTQFLTRWRDEVDKVEEMDDKTAMSLLMNAFRSGDLYTEFCRRPPSSYQEAYNTAWEYAEAEILNKRKRELEEGPRGRLDNFKSDMSDDLQSARSDDLQSARSDDLQNARSDEPQSARSDELQSDTCDDPQSARSEEPQSASHPRLWPAHGHVPAERGNAIPPWHFSICPSWRWNNGPANSDDVVARLGKGREAELARTQRFWSNQQEPAKTRASRQEEEAESQPRGPVVNRLTMSSDRVHQMEAKLERLEKKVGEKNDRDKPLAGSPFTSRVHLTPFPQKVKIDTLRFTGKEDPEIHLDSFNQRSINSFSDLASKFKAKFQENCTKRKKLTYLSTAGQRESENLTQFLTRWTEEVNKVEEMYDKTILSLLLNGLHAGELYKEFFRTLPATYQEAYHTAWEFPEAETQLRAKKETEHRFKPKLVQIKKEEATGPISQRHHYDPIIRVVNTEECQ
ncbi:unnamed protein product [Cuscuta campestris]|uniref:Retrotransposon gag domain-containing protein n=1 Tax=Cuscuta campestris TaxID=132261 RepID=A0A484MW06_9ASTE|nr:unnamed protein product [Cuscuta campestris]